MSDGRGRTLNTMVVRYPLAQQYLDRLTNRFPEISFIVAADDESFRAHLPEADAVVGWGITGTDVVAAPNLRWIQTVGAGVDGLLVPEFAIREIILTNNSGVHAPNIAEHVMAMMLAFARRLPFHVLNQQSHTWGDDAGRTGVFELTDQTLLVVGLGDIGQALAKRAAAFEMKVIGVRRRGGDPTVGVEQVVTMDAMRDEIGSADHVAICLPLTKQTRGLFDRDLIFSMKQGAYLYNIGRGPIIDSKALLEALTSGHLAGAGLDVTDPEPLPSDSPLWDLSNVLITSHTSGATPRYWERAIEILETNIERFRSGGELVNVVDQAMGY